MQADVAILVINGTTGEFEAGFDAGGQTREHALLVRSLGKNPKPPLPRSRRCSPEKRRKVGYEYNLADPVPPGQTREHALLVKALGKSRL